MNREYIGMIAPNASPTGQGFSGVVSGLVGFLYATLLVWLATRTSRSVAMPLCEAIAVLIVWILALIYRGFEIHVTSLVLFAIGLSAWGVTTELNNPLSRTRCRTRVLDLVIGLSITSLLLWFLIALFPVNFVGNDVTTNIFAHAAGFTWGTILALILRRAI